MTKIDRSIFKLSERKKRAKKFRGHYPSALSRTLFLQSLDLVCPKSFPTVFELPKSVKAFASYVSVRKKVGRSGTYKLALLQALS